LIFNLEKKSKEERGVKEEKYCVLFVVITLICNSVRDFLQ